MILPREKVRKKNATHVFTAFSCVFPPDSHSHRSPRRRRQERPVRIKSKNPRNHMHQYFGRKKKTSNKTSLKSWCTCNGSSPLSFWPAIIFLWVPPFRRRSEASRNRTVPKRSKVNAQLLHGLSENLRHKPVVQLSWHPSIQKGGVCPLDDERSGCWHKLYLGSGIKGSRTTEITNKVGRIKEVCDYGSNGWDSD